MNPILLVEVHLLWITACNIFLTMRLLLIQPRITATTFSLSAQTTAPGQRAGTTRVCKFGLPFYKHILALTTLCLNQGRSHSWDLPPLCSCLDCLVKSSLRFQSLPISR